MTRWRRCFSESAEGKPISLIKWARRECDAYLGRLRPMVREMMGRLMDARVEVANGGKTRGEGRRRGAKEAAERERVTPRR